MQHIWWFVGAAALGVVEIFTLDLLFMMLAGGALAAGLAALLGAELWVCILVFAVVSLVLMFTLRPWLRRSLFKSGLKAETNVNALIGRQAFTVTAVSATSGRVKLVGEVWTARISPGVTEDEIPAETPVVVTAIEGATAVVAPLKEK